MLPQYPGPIGPVQPSGMHGIPTGTLLPPPPGYGMMDPATPYPVPAGSQSAPPPPGGSDALVAQGIYPDGGLPADPNAPIPPGATTLPPSAGATPTTAAAAVLGFPGSQFSQAMQQRMAGGGIGAPMDFYNFIKNRGAQPPAAAPQAQPMQPQPRPIVMSATNTSPAQIIPQQAQGQGQGGPPPMPMSMANGPQMGPPPPPPGQIPGGIPANPQMPGFYGNRMAAR